MNEGMKKDERIRQLEQDLEESQGLHQFAVEDALELKKDIRFLLKLVSAPPWLGVPVENEGKVIESLRRVREKVK